MMTRTCTKVARIVLTALALLNIAGGVANAAGADVRIKDLVEFDGVRGNDLVGYGLVVGLPATGDGLRNSPFTEEALSNLLARFGIKAIFKNKGCYDKPEAPE